MPSAIESTALPLPVSQIEDLILASSMLSGEERRSFQVAMALTYGEGNARQAERVFGGGRETVPLGLPEHRTGIIGVGAPAAFGGNRLWEEQHPEVAQALWALADAQRQQRIRASARVCRTRG